PRPPPPPRARPAPRFLLGAPPPLPRTRPAASRPGGPPPANAADELPRTGDLLPRTSLPLPLAEPQDRLVVTVRGAGGDVDGRFELHCHPDGGSHPHVGDACGRLDRRTTWGKDPFAPVEKGAVCTMMYGGPATAHVTGTWAGRPIDARYDRGNGCEIARWDALVPVLPDLRK
ncbi:SSI family serine proteinase inhibitor, partial [Streptomyces neyagawaensis]